jgi:DNA-binding MarR family transcriptional regulator
MEEMASGDPASPMAELLRMMSTQLLSSTVRSLKDQDMSLAELAAVYLLDRDGEMRINGLAGALSLSMPAASRVASGLVTSGLVSRHEDATDRRAKVIGLTKRGRALVDALSVNLAGEVARVLATTAAPITDRIGSLTSAAAQEMVAAFYSDYHPHYYGA